MEDEREDISSDGLNELRIHQRATLRRSLYRSRSHAILAAVVCLVGGAEMFRQAGIFARVHRFSWMIGLIVGAVIAMALSILAIRCAMALHRECQHPVDDQPTSPPDFSTLSEGSQRWKNLEEIR